MKNSRQGEFWLMVPTLRLGFLLSLSPARTYFFLSSPIVMLNGPLQKPVKVLVGGEYSSRLAVMYHMYPQADGGV